MSVFLVILGKIFAGALGVIILLIAGNTLAHYSEWQGSAWSLVITICCCIGLGVTLIKL